MADEATTAQVETLLMTEHFDEEARSQIAEIGDAALEVLTDHATNDRAAGEERVMRSRAILALADWPDNDDALETLDAVFGHRDADNRLRATIALGEMGTDAAVQRLSAFADRAENDLERSSIVRALSTAPVESARQALMAMQDESLSETLSADIARALTPSPVDESEDESE